MRIAIASDHGAFALKELLVPWLRENHDVVDLGTHGPASVDYPDYGYRLAAAIAAGEAEYGVALCGSGIGISIAVNRHPACRCALVHEPLSPSEARRVGQECFSPCRSRWPPARYTKSNNKIHAKTNQI